MKKISLPKNHLKGLKIYCNKCKRYNPKCRHIEELLYRLIVHIPGTKNSVKSKSLISRNYEDAVKESTPIFVDAVRKMSFTDAKNILMGNESAATSYLQTNTTSPLYAKFNPVIKNSFTKVGADQVWASIINKYNSLPMVKKVNPDLTDYTTNKALEGVFKMIAVEEKNIRTDINVRTSPLLQKVFAMQDKK